jgi:phosphoglycerate kinase
MSSATPTFLKKTVRDLDAKGRRIFVRVDFNVPIEKGEVGDDSRIIATLPTLELLRARGARVILASHLGRPKGGPEPKYSLAPVRARLEALLGTPVAWASDCIGPEAERAAKSLGDGGVLLLENLRFHPEEEANDSEFSAALARLGEAYVNDAFGAAHRAHASTVGVTKLLRPAVSGLLMERELEYLGRALDQPERPFVAVLGGAKISGKIDVIRHLMGRVDRLLIGGAMMFTFVRARGGATGRSLVEEDRIPMAQAILIEAGERGVELVLPEDCIVSTAADGSEPSSVWDVDRIGAEEMGVDIGPASVARFGRALADARTVVWNGPMGVFEVPAFAEGTRGVAREIAAATGRGATTVVGGGDSVAAVQSFGLARQFSHLSTGGGASLEFLEGKVLPGVAALDDAAR